MDLSNPAAATPRPEPCQSCCTACPCSPTASAAVPCMPSQVSSRSSLPSERWSNFAAVGLVDVRPVGYSNLYSLNREHVMWPPIEGSCCSRPARPPSNASLR